MVVVRMMLITTIKINFIKLKNNNKMKKILFAIVSISLLVTSCTKDSLIQEEDDVFGFTSLSEARQHLGVYADIFVPTNGSMYIRSTSFASGNVKQAEIFGRYNENSDAAPSDGGTYKLGDIELNFDETSRDYLPTEGNLTNDEKTLKINSLFGKENQFSIKKDGESVIEFNQYLPKKIEVNIENQTPYPNSNLNSIQRDNFKISWNEDNENSHGVVAYLWWNGDRTDLGVSEQGKGENINQSVKLDDNGEAIISAEFFNKIPKNAIISVFFIRGNANIKELDGKSYKFYTVTQEKHNFVLQD